MNPFILAGGALEGAFTPSGYGQYANAMNQIGQQFAPYEKRGIMADKGMAALGMSDVMNPAGEENRLASAFTMSPYQQQMAHNLSRQMNANAAMTGTQYSTAQNAALQNALAGQDNQFMNQYIDRGTQQEDFGQQQLFGLGDMLSQQGYGALQNQAQMQAAAARARMMGGNPFSDALSSTLGLAAGMLK